MNREPIYAALFDRVKAIPGIVFASRRFRHWDDVNRGDCPALFMSQRGQTAMRTRGLPTKWLLDVDLVVYAKVDATDATTPPATIVNGLLDAIENALEPPPYSEVQDLGGLVEHAWIEGQIETDEGVLGNTAVAVIPVRILAA